MTPLHFTHHQRLISLFEKPQEFNNQVFRLRMCATEAFSRSATTALRVAQKTS